MVPPAVVTRTLAVPAARAGVVQVIEVAETVTTAQVAPPMVTALAPVRLVPVIVTALPPAVLPLVGLIAVTVGAGGGTTGVAPEEAAE